MAFLDGLIGGGSVRRQRRLADEFTNKMYDPSIYEGRLGESMRQATEGIDDDNIRTNVMNQIFQSDMGNDAAAFGGNAAAFIAAKGASDEAMGSSLAQAEGQISLQDEQAKAEGRYQYSDYIDQRTHLSNTREAKLKENRMLMEAELDNRRQKLIGGVLKTGMSAAMLSMGVPSGLEGLFGVNEAMEQENQTGIPAAYNTPATPVSRGGGSNFTFDNMMRAGNFILG